MSDPYWRLPDGVDELLPPDARALEHLRRTVLDLFDTWGFDYVEPPVIEFLDALLVGSGSDLDLQTCKFVDLASGRLLGLRADMTSQAVRIDAHSRRTDATQRLCYAGPVVYARPPAVLQSRVPLVAGAELFGEPGLNADAEIVNLLLEVLSAGGVNDPVLVLGHVGITRGLVAALDLDPATERNLLEAIQSKAQQDIESLLDGRGEAIARLPGLMGRADVIAVARRELAGAPAMVEEALTALEKLAEQVRRSHPRATLRFDLAELAGFGYHNGPVFSAYHPDRGRALAKGGRYDGVGARFGRPRPATGFDLDLKQLVTGPVPDSAAVWVPFQSEADADLLASVRALRGGGRRVVFGLRADERPVPECAAELRRVRGKWRVVDFD